MNNEQIDQLGIKLHELKIIRNRIINTSRLGEIVMKDQEKSLFVSFESITSQNVSNYQKGNINCAPGVPSAIMMIAHDPYGRDVMSEEFQDTHELFCHPIEPGDKVFTGKLIDMCIKYWRDKEKKILKDIDVLNNSKVKKITSNSHFRVND